MTEQQRQSNRDRASEGEDQSTPRIFALAGAMDPVVALGAKVDVQEIKDKLEAKRRSLTVSPYKSIHWPTSHSGGEEGGRGGVAYMHWKAPACRIGWMDVSGCCSDSTWWLVGWGGWGCPCLTLTSCFPGYGSPQDRCWRESRRHAPKGRLWQRRLWQRRLWQHPPDACLQIISLPRAVCVLQSPRAVCVLQSVWRSMVSPPPGRIRSCAYKEKNFWDF